MHWLNFLFLLALPLFGKQSERYYQEKFAREIGGQLGSINERTGTNMVANMPAGIIAARTLGEQLAGDD